MFTIHSRLTRAVAVPTLAAFVMTACVPPVRDELDDNCAFHRAPFHRLVEEWNSRITQWILIGGATAAAATLLQGKRSSAAVLRNIVIGSVAGALVGYTIELQKRAKTRDQLILAIRDDSRVAYGRLEQLKRALRDLGQCRVRQLESLRGQLQEGRINREVTKQQLARIREWITNDWTLVQNATGLVDQQTKIFIGSYADVTNTPVDQLLREWQNYRPEPTSAGEGTTVAGEGTHYTTTALRLRAGPATGYPVLTVIPRDAAVRVLREEGGWAEVDYAGRRGFVTYRYLSARRPDPARPRVIERSGQTPDPVMQVAYAERELAAESEVTKQELDRTLADLDELLRTQGRHERTPVRIALIAP